MTCPRCECPEAKKIGERQLSASEPKFVTYRCVHCGKTYILKEEKRGDR